MKTMSDGFLELLRDWQNRALLARKEAHHVLAKHEASKSRVVILDDLLGSLSGFPVDIKDYFQEAVTCLENNLLRSAVVLSWAGFFHVLSESLFHRHEKDIKAKRPKWKFKGLIELKENYPESQILDVAKEVKLTKKSDLKIYQGQLATRNQCAHPTLYKPSLNEAIGFVDKMVRQISVFLSYYKNG